MIGTVVRLDEVVPFHALPVMLTIASSFFAMEASQARDSRILEPPEGHQGTSDSADRGFETSNHTTGRA